MRPADPRPLVALALVAALALGACSSTDAGKEASTPTSIGDPTVAAKVEGLQDSLLSADELEGDFAQVAEVDFTEFGLCGGDLLDEHPAAGRLAVAFGDSVENLLFENVLVFRDSNEATAFMDAFVAEAARCEAEDEDGAEEDGTGPSVAVLPDPQIGDRSAAVEIEGSDTGGRPYQATMVIAQNYSVALVVSAVNLGEPGIDPDVVEETAATAVDRIRKSERGTTTTLP